MYNVQCTERRERCWCRSTSCLADKRLRCEPPLLPNHFGWLLFSAQSLANLVSKPTNVLHDRLCPSSSSYISLRHSWISSGAVECSKCQRWAHKNYCEWPGRIHSVWSGIVGYCILYHSIHVMLWYWVVWVRLRCRKIAPNGLEGSILLCLLFSETSTEARTMDIGEIHSRVDNWRTFKVCLWEEGRLGSV